MPLKNRTKIAIVGMACRFPGANSIPEFWDCLANGRETISEVPSSRFPIEKFYDPRPQTEGKIVTRRGGFIDGVREFDPVFFGLSPRIAWRMDPQQRLLMMVTWEAFEDAGIPRSQFRGSQTGVYVGLLSNDYEVRSFPATDDLNVYSIMGTDPASASGRLSHAFDLRGPSETLATQCSSSLVAVVHACEFLRQMEGEMALAGGANVILDPRNSIAFSNSGLLSPDGRCKFGDASADGYVRSEGIGVVILKRLDDALEDGDRIYAVIERIESNNDARSGHGTYMRPSQSGQRQLLERIYGGASLEFDRLQYVEAHGTGTEAGDPAEIEALQRAIAERRSVDPLLVGSVKTNIGHTESTAGIAGLVKAALTLNRRVVPPSLHFETPNPDIPWEELGLEIATAPKPLSDEGEVYAGVNSFGLSGTNAHALLSTPPSAEKTRSRLDRNGGYQILAVSAHSDRALEERIDQARELEKAPENRLENLCYTVARRRSALEYRRAVVGRTPSDLEEELGTISGGERAIFEVSGGRPSLAFVFSGQGGQWKKMGVALADRYQLVEETIDECDGIIRDQEGWSVWEALTEPGADWLDRLPRIQPLVFVVQIATSRLWRSWGVEPDVVVGHSMGEVAAAHAAGALCIEDACRVICRRSAVVDSAAPEGRMAVVGRSLEEMKREVASREGVEIGGQTGPASVIVTGDVNPIDQLVEELERRGEFARIVDVDYASHSRHMESLLDEFVAEVEGLEPREGTVPLFSTVEARQISGEQLDASYWCRNLREPVQFYPVIRELVDEGMDLFVEPGPHPVLRRGVEQTIREGNVASKIAGSLKRDEPEQSHFERWLGRVWEWGYPVDWSFRYPNGKQVRLPTYPFQTDEHWYDEEKEVRPERHAGGSGRRDRSPLLPDYMELYGDRHLHAWEVPLDVGSYPFLRDHQVRGAHIFPGAGYIEMMLGAAGEVTDKEEVVLREVDFGEYLPVPADESLRVQVVLADERAKGLPIEIRTDAPLGDENEWAEHASARAITSSDELGSVRRTRAEERNGETRILERLRLELDRRRHNPSYAFSLLSLRVRRRVGGEVSAFQPVEGKSKEFVDANVLADRLHRIVRDEDHVYILDDHECVAVFGNSEGLDHLELTASRLRDSLLERLPNVQSGVAMGLQYVDSAYWEPEELLESVTEQAERLDEGIEISSGQAAPERIGKEEFYRRLHRRGLDYGPSFQSVETLGATREYVQASLHIPDELGGLHRFSLHPALLDGCFQVAVLFADYHAETAPSTPVLPTGAREIRWYQTPDGPLTSRVWFRGSRGTDKRTIEADIVVVDDQNAPVVEIDGFQFREFVQRTTYEATSSLEGWFYRWRWNRSTDMVASSQPSGEAARTYWVVDPLGEWGASMVSALEQRGVSAVGICGGHADSTDWADYCIEIGDFGSIPGSPSSVSGVVVTMGQGPGSSGPNDVEDRLVRDGMNAVEVYRGLANWFEEGPQQAGSLPVWVLTETAAAISPEGNSEIRPGQRGLWGIHRVAMNEYPSLQPRILDLDRDRPLSRRLDDAVSEILGRGAETEIAYRGGERYVHRLEPISDIGEAAKTEEPGPSRRQIDEQEPYQVRFNRGEEDEKFTFHAVDRPELEPGEVEIAVDAIEVSLPDVVGMSEGDSAAFGSACVGQIERTASREEGFETGQRVVARTSQGGAASRFVTVDSRLVCPIPDIDAAAPRLAHLAGSYLHVAFAFHYAGLPDPGDSILICGAAGGVGRAAIECMRRFDVELFVSAEHLATREQLRELPVEHVIPAEQREVSRQVASVTGGRGVEIVLSLPRGSSFSGSADLLAPMGRFIRLGGVETGFDHGAVQSVGCTFSVISLEEAARFKPGIVGEVLSELVSRISDGELPLLPAEGTYEVTDLSTAYEQVNSRRALETTPVRMSGRALDVYDSRTGLFEVSASYVLIGGLGGLGLEVAEWMAQNGAGKLVLANRSGPNKAAKKRCNRIEAETNATVVTSRVDVSEKESVSELFASLREDDWALKGVFHLAGVLDDAILDEQNPAKFHRAMAPKVTGSQLLDEVTREGDFDLDYFVLFSSAGAVVGSPGQANYIAANSFMDALARRRREEGRPALSIGWGAWAEIGLAAENSGRGDRLEARGMASMSPEEGLRALKRVLAERVQGHVAIFPMDWDRWSETYPHLVESPTHAHLLGETEDDSQSDAEVHVRRIHAASDEEKIELVEEYLREVIADVLTIRPSRLDGQAPLSRFGVDSLMSIEIQGRVRAELDVEIRDSSLYLSESLRGLAKHLTRAVVRVEQEERSADNAGIDRIDLEDDEQRKRQAPLTYNQRAILLLHQQIEDLTSYHLPVTLRFDADVDSDRIRAALRGLVRRHWALRCTFPTTDHGVPRQDVRPLDEIDFFTERDVREDQSGSRNCEIRELRERLVDTPMDLSEEIPLRIGLVRSAEGATVILVFHEIAVDGWSLWCIVRDLASLYRKGVEVSRDGAQEGTENEAKLPDLELQFVDYARWKHRQDEEGVFDERLTYWTQCLEGCPDVVELPRKKQGEQKKPLPHPTGTVEIDVKPVSERSIRGLAAECETTPFAVVASAFAAALCRMATQEEFLIAVLDSGRDQRVRNVVGPLVNLLPLKQSIPVGITFEALIQRQSRMWREAKANSVPLAKLVEELDPPRRRGRTRLIDIVFGFENLPAFTEEFSAEELPFEVVGVEDIISVVSTDQTDVGMTFNVRMEEGNLTGELQYDAVRFDRSIAGLLRDEFCRILEYGLDEPDQPVRSYPVLDGQDWRTIIGTWGEGPHREAPEPILRDFGRQVRQNPHESAVVYDGGEWSYSTLSRKADQVANELLANGVEPGDRVGVHLSRSPELPAAMLGIWNAGASYVPLDPDLAPKRLEFIAADSGIEWVVTKDPKQARKQLGGVQTVSLREDAEVWNVVPEESSGELPGTISEASAYVIYTSGTTGRPKGVTVSHDSVAHQISAAAEAYERDENDTVLQKSPTGFDMSVTETFGPLASGGTVAIAEPGGEKDPEYLVEAVKRWDVTLLKLVPTTLELIMARHSFDDCESLRWVATAGEALRGETRNRFYDRHGDLTLSQAYGITETCVGVTCWECEAEAEGVEPSVGFPLPYYEVRILNAMVEPVPPRIAGELFVGGPGVAEGYVGRPRKTAENFLPDPFTGRAGGRMYRSGDFGRWREDGAIRLLGREDRQVQVYGVRIELDEVEAQLMGHPEVDHCAVVPDEDDEGRIERLLAYVQLAESSSSSEISEASMSRYLRDRVHESAVPARYIELDEIPRNSSGKLRRSDLPEPKDSAPPTERTWPETETEEEIAEIWREHLEVEEVGIHENFFEIGGHSLLAVRVQTDFEEEFGISLPVRVILERPTIDELADYVLEKEMEQVAEEELEELLADLD